MPSPFLGTRMSKPANKHGAPAHLAKPGPSLPLQNVPLNVPPALAHPRRPRTARILGEPFPSAGPTAALSPASVAWDGPDEAWLLELELLLDSPRESIAPESYGLAQTKRLPVPAAGPPEPATGWRSLSQSTPPGSALPRLRAPLGSPLGAPDLKPSLGKYTINSAVMQPLLPRLY